MRKWTAEQKAAQKARIVEYRRKLKVRMIAYKGGSCQICGYDKHPAALEFHHRNPADKKFKLSGNSLKFEAVRAELDKCDLLCANCHREVEANSVGM